MEPFFSDFLKIYTPLYESIRKAVAELPQEALDWSPKDEENSIAVLAVHVAGANTYLIRDVIQQEASGRNREAEFQTRGLRSAEILAKLEAQHQLLLDALPGLTLADLHRERISPRTGKPVTVAWALLHLLEHTALHAGHVDITRLAWEARGQ